MSWQLADLAEIVAGIVIGDARYVIDSIGTLETATASQISFLTNLKYKRYLSTTIAGAVIVDGKSAEFITGNAIVVDNPHAAYARIATALHPPRKPIKGFHPSAWIDPTSQCGSNVCIAANAVIEADVVLEDGVIIGAGSIVGRNSRLAANTQLMANVTVYEGTTIGRDGLIHSGAIIGSDGFGFAQDAGDWIKIPQIGNVRIGNQVEIGANTTIDRGAINDTVIGDGVKIDNQVHIAHNVNIGAHTIIAGCTGFAGSTDIGMHCIIGGAVNVSGHLTIADNVVLLGGASVTKSIKQPGVYSSIIPADAADKWNRNIVRFRQLDKLNQRVAILEKGIN